MTDVLDLAQRHAWPGYECDSCGADGFRAALLDALIAYHHPTVAALVLEQLAAKVCHDEQERRRLERWRSRMKYVCWRRMEHWNREQARICEAARRAALSQDERDVEDAQRVENERKLFSAFESMIQPPLDSGSMSRGDVCVVPASAMFNLINGLRGQRNG